MQHLFTVEDTYDLRGRAVVLGPGVAFAGPPVKVGDAIQLRKPDGSVVNTSIRGIETLHPDQSERAPVLLPDGLHKEDVPVGTEVYLAVET